MKQISWKSPKSTKSTNFVALEKGTLQYIMVFYTFSYYNHCVFSLQKAATTSASNMYTVCPTIHYRANYQDVPVVVGTVSIVLV